MKKWPSDYNHMLFKKFFFFLIFIYVLGQDDQQNNEVGQGNQQNDKLGQTVRSPHTNVGSALVAALICFLPNVSSLMNLKISF